MVRPILAARLPSAASASVDVEPVMAEAQARLSSRRTQAWWLWGNRSVTFRCL